MASSLVAKIMPGVLMSTVGVVAPEMKHYIRYMEQVQFYNGAAGWALGEFLQALPVPVLSLINSGLQQSGFLSYLWSTIMVL